MGTMPSVKRKLRDFWFRRVLRRPIRTYRAAVSIKFALDVDIKDEPVDGLFHATVQPLGIATYGSSQQDAVAQVQDAIESYLVSLAEHGEMVSEFSRLGVEFSIVNVVVSDPNPHFAIPDATTPHSFGTALVPA
jgi:predicted RNase H-like HicB family nuclease